MKDTSIEAYQQIKPDLNRQQNQLYVALKKLGAGTCQQMTYACDLDYEQCKRRMSELVKMGKAIDSGKRGKTSSGRSAIIWEVVK